ncbi:hypothetical protein T484DRAFT_1917278 [Baffinella frigidus]|nr:hypothetical protein T484DRAFT_1917278 [Cryptophyta sp. CCMP2293]
MQAGFAATITTTVTAAEGLEHSHHIEVPSFFGPHPRRGDHAPWDLSFLGPHGAELLLPRGGATTGGGGPELLRRVPSTDAEEEARPQIHLVVRSSRPAYHVMQR